MIYKDEKQFINKTHQNYISIDEFKMYNWVHNDEYRYQYMLNK